jgi:hypothetical protein
VSSSDCCRSVEVAPVCEECKRGGAKREERHRPHLMCNEGDPLAFEPLESGRRCRADRASRGPTDSRRHPLQGSQGSRDLFPAFCAIDRLFARRYGFPPLSCSAIRRGEASLVQRSDRAAGRGTSEARSPSPSVPLLCFERSDRRGFARSVGRRIGGLRASRFRAAPPVATEPANALAAG